MAQTPGALQGAWNAFREFPVGVGDDCGMASEADRQLGRKLPCTSAPTRRFRQRDAGAAPWFIRNQGAARFSLLAGVAGRVLQVLEEVTVGVQDYRCLAVEGVYVGLQRTPEVVELRVLLKGFCKYVDRLLFRLAA